MREPKENDSEVEKFKTDLARFSGNYREYLVIVKSASGRLHWKSTDKTWALGAIQRYKWTTDEWDREEERQAMEELE